MLEIGSGTGQATLPLAEREFQVMAIELGRNLAAVARRKLARFPNVTVVGGAFEDSPLPPEPFDAVVSATAFHWLDPSVRASRTADALRPGGVLATITTHHIDGGDVQFFIDVQDCYRRWFPESAGIRLPTRADLPQDTSEVEHIAQLILERYGRRIRKRYLNELRIARRRDLT